MKNKKKLMDILFDDEELQGEEDSLTEEEIEGYSYCNGNKEKCMADCSSTVLLPIITSMK